MQLPPKLIAKAMAGFVLMVVLAATVALFTFGLLLYSAWHIAGGQ